MSKLMERINNEINSQAMKYGTMGTENVSVTLILSEDEKQEFWKLKLNNHYSYELEGYELSIIYTETIKINRDSRKWVKVFPRNFSNEYYFIGFEDSKEKNNFMDAINNEPNSSAHNCRKSKVENSDCFSFDKEKNYWILDGQKIEDKKQGRL